MAQHESARQPSPEDWRQTAKDAQESIPTNIHLYHSTQFAWESAGRDRDCVTLEECQDLRQNMMLEREIQQGTFIHGSSIIRSDVSNQSSRHFSIGPQQQHREQLPIKQSILETEEAEREDREGNSPNTGEQHKQRRRHPGNTQA